MATWASVSRVVLALPATSEILTKDGRRQWNVKDKLLAWERPLRRSDLAALGDRAPAGPILSVYVPDLETKDAMVTSRSEVYFTTPHFDGYAMVLIRLGAIPIAELTEVLREAWRARAPKRLLLEREATRAPKVASKRRPAK